MRPGRAEPAYPLPRTAISDPACPTAVLFLEFQAGEGGLTQAVAAAGVAVEPPDELASGGFDFSVAADMIRLRAKLARLRAAGRRLIVHLAPPCATFSAARNRSTRTQMRSSRFPAGLPSLGADARRRAEEANAIALACFSLAAWAHGELGAVVSLENPRSSYIWPFADQSDVEQGEWEDRSFSQCMYGTPYKKETRLRIWGPGFVGMDKRCNAAGTHFACGRTVAEGHTKLGFGGASTAAAAAYPPGVCAAWAQSIARLAGAFDPEDRVVTTRDGKVRRHVDRGLVADSGKETRRHEDLACQAGMRNPWSVVERWPELAKAMSPVYLALLGFIHGTPGARNLWQACGEDASRSPPSEELVTAAREAVAVALNLTFDEAEAHHQASPWRHNIVEQVVARSGDPDSQLVHWLREGAPVGLARSIEPGGLFPPVEPEEVLALEDLEQLEKVRGNHPSFMEAFGEAAPPGVGIIQGYIDSGFGELYVDQSAAEAALGGPVFPAPLGNVTKLKADGQVKHRIIQDLRANSVNRSVRLPERQVLPRPVDHARDMADLSAHTNGLSTLVLDFKDAFMSIPLHEAERRYCCAEVPQGLERRRTEISPGEPLSGNFVSWRVLGFGGRSFPLVFSRAASFAARTAQALFWSAEEGRPRDQEAWTRLQLYVDDPVISMASSDAGARRRSADLILWWWLALGIPLAWAKGRWTDGASCCHSWIGVDFKMDDSEAVITLPTAFVNELIELLQPLAAGSGHITEKAAQTIVGKCNRVAQVVPEARPFVGAMYAALTAAQHAQASGRREAPPKRVPSKRFAVAARWMLQVLSPAEPVLPLERRIQAGGPEAIPDSAWTAQFDASPWGGGAVLREGIEVREYWFVEWRPEDVDHLDVQLGQPSAQCFLEFLALLCCLVLWGDSFQHESLQLVGDNTAALTAAIQLKGSGPMLAIARELAWRKARKRWAFKVGHIATEANKIPDRLSRMHDPCPASFPGGALAKARQVACPSVQHLWALKMARARRPRDFTRGMAHRFSQELP